MNIDDSTDQEMADVLSQVEESFDDDDFEAPTVEEASVEESVDAEEVAPEETADTQAQSVPDYPEWDEISETFSDLSPEQQNAIKARMKREVDRFHGSRGQELESLRRRAELAEANQQPQPEPEDTSGIPRETWEELSKGLIENTPLGEVYNALIKAQQQLPQARETQVKGYLDQQEQGQFAGVDQYKADRPLIEKLLQSVNWDWQNPEVSDLLNQRWAQYHEAAKSKPAAAQQRQQTRRRAGVESTSSSRSSDVSGIPKDMTSMDDILPFVAENIGE